MNNVEKCKALVTDDFQGRSGDYPRSNKPVDITYFDGKLVISFKNTYENHAIQLTRRLLVKHDIEYESVIAEQTGEYENDWVETTTIIKV